MRIKSMLLPFLGMKLSTAPMGYFEEIMASGLFSSFMSIFKNKTQNYAVEFFKSKCRNSKHEVAKAGLAYFQCQYIIKFPFAF